MIGAGLIALFILVWIISATNCCTNSLKGKVEMIPFYIFVGCSLFTYFIILTVFIYGLIK